MDNKTEISNEWSIKNIPVPEIKLKSNLNKATGILELRSEIMGYITKELIELNSLAVRQTLVALGWTTPETGQAIHNVLEEMEREEGHVCHYWAGRIRDAMNETEKTT